LRKPEFPQQGGPFTLSGPGFPQIIHISGDYDKCDVYKIASYPAPQYRSGS